MLELRPAFRPLDARLEKLSTHINVRKRFTFETWVFTLNASLHGNSDSTELAKSVEKPLMSKVGPLNMQTNTTVEKGYVLRPKYENKFTLRKVEPLLRDALIDELSNVKGYDPEKADQLAVSVMRAVRKRLKESAMKAYKFVVQCVVFERCGQGIEYGASVSWDSDTDGCARQIFHGDTFVCVVTAFGIFHY